MGKSRLRTEENPDYSSSRRRGRGLPRPTLEFRRRSWQMFQRALDPLGPLKPLQRPPH